MSGEFKYQFNCHFHDYSLMIGNSINVYFILVVRLFGGEKVQYMHVYAQDPGHAVCYAKVKCKT